MRKITDDLWIGPQPSADDYARAKAAGIARIINNRPDGEEPGQPAAAEAAGMAREQGLSYAHIPVVSSQQITLETVRRFQEAMVDAGGPVLAHCKSGMRSLALWAIGEVLDGRMAPDDLDALGARAGVDLTGAKNWLRANR